LASRFQGVGIHNVLSSWHSSTNLPTVRTMRMSSPHLPDVRTHEELNSLLRIHGGLVARRYHPQLAGSFDWLLRGGRLTPVLPGVYAAPEIAGSWQTRAQALALRYHDAVLLGSAAAQDFVLACVTRFPRLRPLISRPLRAATRSTSPLVSDAKPGDAQSSSAPAPSGSISSTLRPVSAASCSTIVR
jgi:hypothetical protein